MTKEYEIAGFRLRITGGDWRSAAGHFGRALSVFERPADGTEPLFVLHTHTPVDTAGAWRELARFDFLETAVSCLLQRNGRGHLLTMTPTNGRQVRFFMPREGGEALTDAGLSADDTDNASIFRFGMWILFGLAIAPHGAIAIHSSTICCRNRGILFLGESGTGKSTHTRLWRETVPGAVLLNDDSPIVRIEARGAMVYGSPWSGKSPCYKDEAYPIAGFVRLSQAPHNCIRRLDVLHAIGALLPSCPPAFAQDEELQDGICRTLSSLIDCAPVYHLECLPDADAARLSYETLLGHDATHDR